MNNDTYCAALDLCGVNSGGETMPRARVLSALAVMGKTFAFRKEFCGVSAWRTHNQKES